MHVSHDEEALAAHVSFAEKKARGAFFTPEWLVQRTLDAVAPFVSSRELRVVDPSCGAGAFLVAAAERWPRAELLGVELNARSAALCRQRLAGTRATIVTGNALLDDWLPPRGDAFELWVGNPPYNGTSPLLKSPRAWARACAWLPEEVTLQPGTSLREDFVFFLLRASLRLTKTRGALAFITSATLLDAWAHEPVRNALTSRMQLREVHELARGTFARTQVKPCLTVWTTPARGTSVPFKKAVGNAYALDASWRRRGATVAELVPVTFAGLKTRFDELLVDEDRARLARRVREFLDGRRVALPGFEKKLAALRAFAGAARFDEKKLRRFLHPSGARAWCYVDRALIPRGDHRFRGDYDPHASRLKLVFNAHELPLHAQVLDEDGCVTMYRHTRFAPEFVPRALLERRYSRTFDADDLVPNLTELGARWGTPREVFTRIAKHIESNAFQDVWAPAFGTVRPPLIAFD